MSTVEEKTPLLDTNVYFRWASADGSRLEQWNQLRQRWMPSKRAIYRHCLRSGDAVVMNPVWRLSVTPWLGTGQQSASYVHPGE